jgi:hypothetical protein
MFHGPKLKFISTVWYYFPLIKRDYERKNIENKVKIFFQALWIKDRVYEAYHYWKLIETIKTWLDKQEIHNYLMFDDRKWAWNWVVLCFHIILDIILFILIRGCRGRARMVVGFFFYNYLYNQCLSPLKLWVRTLFMGSKQHYAIKFVSDLWQVGGYSQVLRFPPPIKLTATI